MTTATKKKSADVWEKVERALSTLSTEGMIASLEYFTFNKESELTLLSRGQEVVIYCTLYFRDTDDVSAFTTLVNISGYVLFFYFRLLPT